MTASRLTIIAARKIWKRLRRRLTFVLWRWRLGRKAELYFLAAWLAACGVLLATGFQGGVLVFTHGMGVATEGK